jgi:tRNA G18 (ribose-2'-O)-methylase SpoU
MITRVEDPEAPALAPYRDVATPAALEAAGLFVAEGRLVLPRLFASPYRVQSVLVSDAALESLSPLLDVRPDVEVLVAPLNIVNTVGGYNFHRGCLALARRDATPDLDGLLDAAAARPGRPLVVLEAVTNPDNIGGIFRSAHAFDAAGVVLGPRCGDPLYRKAIRTSMGTSLQMTWARTEAWPGALARVRARGYPIVALTTDAGAPPLSRVAAGARERPVALLAGSEGEGLSAAALAAADAHARIPMPRADADSFNVTMAVSIALYELLPRGV